MGRDRVGQVPQFRDVRCGGDIKTLAVVVDGRVRSSQVRWQAAVHRWVKKLGGLREEELAEVVQRETSLFHGVGDVHGLEVASVVDLAGFSVDEWVVGGYKHVQSIRKSYAKK